MTSDTVLHFPTGIVGFPEAREFTLTPTEDPAVFDLQCVSEPGLGFVVVVPGAFFPDYSPVVDDEAVEALALQSAADALVLLIVTLGAEPQDATANLLAPVVVNRHTRTAAQVVLVDQDFELRVPVVR